MEPAKKWDVKQCQAGFSSHVPMPRVEARLKPCTELAPPEGWRIKEPLEHQDTVQTSVLRIRQRLAAPQEIQSWRRNPGNLKTSIAKLEKEERVEAVEASDFEGTEIVGKTKLLIHPSNLRLLYIINVFLRPRMSQQVKYIVFSFVILSWSISLH